MTESKSKGARSGGQPDKLSEAYPSVVVVERKWVEIWCNLCGANATLSRPRHFFDGFLGVLYHMTNSHREKSVHYRLEDVMETCGRRALSSEDVKRIRRGQKPKVDITMRFQGGASGGGPLASKHDEELSILNDDLEGDDSA